MQIKVRYSILIVSNFYFSTLAFKDGGQDFTTSYAKNTISTKTNEIRSVNINIPYVKMSFDLFNA